MNNKIDNIKLYSVLILSIAFYFVVNVDHFFSWWVPDELNSIVAGKQSSYFSCVKNYYLYTTINRLTSDLVICSTNFIANFGATPFRGLVIAKLILSLSLPISVGYLVYKSINGQFINSLSIGFFLVGIVSVINFEHASMLYSMDMAIYTTANSLLIIMLALDKSKFLEGRYYIYLFIFFIAACSHEVVLALVGLLIIEITYFLFVSKAYKNIFLILSIYIFSAISYFITPGYRNRLLTWPASATPAEAFYYMLGTFKYIFTHLFEYLLILAIVFFLGFVASMMHKYKKEISAWKILRLLMYAIAYLIVTSFLVGLSKTLWIHLDGGIYPRITFEIYLLITIAIFLSGHLTGNLLKIGCKLANSESILYSSLIYSSILISLIFLHPDLNIFLKVNHRFFNENISDITDKNYSIIVQNNYFLSTVSTSIFRREVTPNAHKFPKYFDIDKSLSSYSIDNLKYSNIHNKINELIDLETERHFYLRSIWLKYLFLIYKKDYYEYMSKYSECSWFVPPISPSKCDISSNDFDFLNLSPINLKKITSFSNINVIVKNINGENIIYDNDSYGEHYIETSVKVSKGIYALTVIGYNNQLKNYIYLISQGKQILIPWSKKATTESYYYEYGTGSGLDLLFSQAGTEEGSNKNFINILFRSSGDMDLSIRYQHASDTTVYVGNPNSYSKILSLNFGEAEQNK